MIFLSSLLDRRLPIMSMDIGVVSPPTISIVFMNTAGIFIENIIIISPMKEEIIPGFLGIFKSPETLGIGKEHYTVGPHENAEEHVENGSVYHAFLSKNTLCHGKSHKAAV